MYEGNTSTMATAAEIETRIDNLRENYSDFPVEVGEYYHSPETYQRVRDLHEDGIHGASRVWVERGHETLLVREESRPQMWSIAGGLIEPNESAVAAGEREVMEETGIECIITDVANVHRAKRYQEDQDPEHGDTPIEELAVAFIAEYVAGELRAQAGEIRAVDWWSSIPESSHPTVNRIAEHRFDS